METFDLSSDLVQQQERVLVHTTTNERVFGISAQPFTNILFTIVASLVTLNLLGIYLSVSQILPEKITTQYYRYVDFAKESNLPTVFSCIILFTASLLLYYVYASTAKTDPIRKFWKLMSVVFLYMCIDEGSNFHERFSIIRKAIPVQLPSIFHYAWIIPYAVLLIALGIYIFKYLFALPKATRNRFIIAGAVFVAGAMGCEVMEGYFDELYGLENKVTLGIICLEETLEMTGVVLFIRAILLHLEASGQSLSITPRPLSL